MNFLYPNWPVPTHIQAAVTLVPSGLDLSWDNVDRNLHEQQLVELLRLPSMPVWLRQVHGSEVIWADEYTSYTDPKPEADASIANYGNTVCAVLTADCLPILLCDNTGQQIAAIHAGWRGQVAGVIEATVNNMTVPASKLLAWLGPAIGPTVYEVGGDVYDQIMQMPINIAKHLFFHHIVKNKWLLDLYAMARCKLQHLGVPEELIFGGEWCTYSNSQLFYSYRRSKTTKRMASLIWFDL